MIQACILGWSIYNITLLCKLGVAVTFSSYFQVLLSLPYFCIFRVYPLINFLQMLVLLSLFSQIKKKNFFSDAFQIKHTTSIDSEMHFIQMESNGVVKQKHGTLL